MRLSTKLQFHFDGETTGVLDDEETRQVHIRGSS